MLTRSRLSFISGVSTAITAPVGTIGISTAFYTGARNALEDGAILQEDVALHLQISRDSSASVSTQIAALRKTLLKAHHRIKHATDGKLEGVNGFDNVATVSKSYMCRKLCLNFTGLYALSHSCGGRGYHGFTSKAQERI